MTEQAPGHEVRRFVHQIKGQSYKAFADFAEAAQDPDAAVVLSGDYGGTIYLTAPMRIVRCDERALNTLLSDLDAMTWMGGAEYGASVAYERHPVPDGVFGGHGGGVVIDGVWTHPRLDNEVAEHARQVVEGERLRIPGVVVRSRRAASVERRRKRRAEPQNVAFLEKHKLAWDYDILEPMVPLPEDEG